MGLSHANTPAWRAATIGAPNQERAAHMAFVLHYWSYRVKHSDEFETLDDAVRAAFWMTEYESGAPDHIECPDGTTISRERYPQKPLGQRPHPESLDGRMRAYEDSL